MDAAHGNKDLDDLILHLVRDPAFPTKVNDIAVECGNSLYQSVLDRYIAGADIPFSEARQVWRNTTQPMCDVSAFYEELFPLVRRINQKLLPEKRIRVLAGDPPLDWSKVKDKSEVNVGSGCEHCLSHGKGSALETPQSTFYALWHISPFSIAAFPHR